MSLLAAKRKYFICCIVARLVGMRPGVRTCAYVSTDLSVWVCVTNKKIEKDDHNNVYDNNNNNKDDNKNDNKKNNNENDNNNENTYVCKKIEKEIEKNGKRKRKKISRHQNVKIGRAHV